MSSAVWLEAFDSSDEISANVESGEVTPDGVVTSNFAQNPNDPSGPLF